MNVKLVFLILKGICIVCVYLHCVSDSVVGEPVAKGKHSYYQKTTSDSELLVCFSALALLLG